MLRVQGASRERPLVFRDGDGGALNIIAMSARLEWLGTHPVGEPAKGAVEPVGAWPMNTPGGRFFAKWDVEAPPTHEGPLSVPRVGWERRRLVGLAHGTPTKMPEGRHVVTAFRRWPTRRRRSRLTTTSTPSTTPNPLTRPSDQLSTRSPFFRFMASDVPPCQGSIRCRS